MQAFATAVKHHTQIGCFGIIVGAFFLPRDEELGILAV